MKLPKYFRPGLLIGLSVVMLGLSVFLQPPLAWATVFLMAIAVCFGTDEAMKSHPEFRLLAPTFPPALWILPGLLTLGSVLFLRMVPTDPLKIAGLFASIVLFLIVIVSEYRGINPTDRWFGIARFVLHMVTYVVAAGFYIAIFHREMGNLFAASAIGLISLLLSLELFRENAGDAVRAWLYAGTVALMLAQMAFAMGFVPLNALVAGVVALLAFYLFTGIVLNHFAQRLTRGTVTEFIVVAFVGLVFLYVRSFI